MSNCPPSLRLPLVALVALAGLVASCKGGTEAPSSGLAAPVQGERTGVPPDGPASKGGTEGALPPGHPPIGERAGIEAAIAPEAGAGTGGSAVAWAAPDGWIEETPASPARRAQYRVPGPGGDAECAVFYFGPGQGGDPMSNVERWASQFRNADGTAAEPKTTRRRVGSMDVLVVEAAGTYEAGSSMGAPSNPKPGYMLLGAIAEGPDANWFFKVTGPEKTVNAERAAFERLIDSLKRGE